MVNLLQVVSECNDIFFPHKCVNPFKTANTNEHLNKELIFLPVTEYNLYCHVTKLKLFLFFLIGMLVKIIVYVLVVYYCCHRS